jgi:general secretion pathway protein D
MGAAMTTNPSNARPTPALPAREPGAAVHSAAGIAGAAVSRRREALALRRLAGGAMALAAATALLAGAAGCSSKPKPARTFEPVEAPVAMRTPPAWNSGARPVTQTIGPVRQERLQERPQLLSSAAFQATPAGAAEVGLPSMSSLPPGDLMQVRYAAGTAPVVDVLRVLIQDFLEEDFLIDSSFSGNQQITFSIDREMTRTEVRDLVASLALITGGRLERRSGMLILRSESTGGGAAAGPARPAAGGNAVGSLARNPDTPLIRSQTAFGGAMPVIRVHSFRSVKPETLTPLLQAFLTPGATVVAAGSVMVIADSASNVDRVMGLLELVDKPVFAGTQVWTYRIRHRTPESIKQVLETIATGAGVAATGNEPLVAFVPVANSDLLMVVSRDPSIREVVTDMIYQTDRPRDSMARNRYIYRVQHFPTDALAKIIEDYHVDRVVMGAQTRRSGSGETGFQQQTDLARIVANDPQNLLLIEATPDDYADIMSTIRAVDRPPQQVFLRSVIAEVGLNDTLRYGVEYFLETQEYKGLGLFEFSGLAPMPGAAAASGGAFFVGTDGLAVVEALRSASEVSILSQPTLTIANNAEAEFQVGGSVPVVAADVDAATQVGGDTAIRRSIEYRDTGLLLKIKPRINESGEVTLAISHEINEVGNRTELGPEFSTRLLSTTVTVPHGHTVVLGGIIRQTQRDGTTKIPIVGELPVVGALFQSRDITAERTELFITITPTIINTPSEAALVSSPFLDATHAVRRFLHEMRSDLPEGSLADPRYLAMRDNAPPLQVFELPPSHREAFGQPGQPGPAVPSQPAQPQPAQPAEQPPATPTMPPIMQMLLESASGQSAPSNPPAPR